MPTLRIPTPLRSYVNGQSEVKVQGCNVAEALNSLVTQYPTLRQHLFNSENKLRSFINLFLNEDNIKNLQGLETPLQAEDWLVLIPSIAGG